MKFTTRDLLWLTLVATLVLGWSMNWIATRKPTGSVNGSIQINGTQLTDGYVVLHSPDGQLFGDTASKGYFGIQSIPVGDYQVSVHFDGAPAHYRNGGLSMVVEVHEGVNQIELDLK